MVPALISKAKPQCKATYHTFILDSSQTHLQSKINHLNNIRTQVHQIPVLPLVLNLRAMNRLIMSRLRAKIG